ncbi:MAG: hypothetical protein JST28_08925 [Acidobacteria bacterium]|nr:hypothetical protein [Acidobacteriota bacterium]
MTLSIALICMLAGGCRKSAAPAPGSSSVQHSSDTVSSPSVADELFDFKRHPRRSMLRPLDVSTMSETEKKYGRAPQLDPSVEYQPGIILMTQGDKAIRSVGTDGMSWTFDANAPHVNEFEQGKIVFATGRAVGRILYVKHEADTVKVVLGPIQLTDVIRNGDFGMSADIDPRNALVYINPDIPQPGVEKSKPNTAQLDSPWKGWHKTVVVSSVSVTGKWTPMKMMKVDREGRATNFHRVGRRWARTGYQPAVLSGFARRGNGAPRFERTTWAGQFGVPSVAGPSINAPKIPSLDVPKAITVNAADLTAHPFVTGTSIGVQYVYDKNDLHYEATGVLELHNLHANFGLGILNGVPGDSGLDLGGELGVHVHLNAHTSQNFHVNSQTKLWVPVDFSIPIGGPVPFALSFEQAAIINTGFSAKNSIMNADGIYKLTGGLKAGRFGGNWGVSAPMSISYTNDVGRSLEGLSVGINSLVLGCSLEGIVGLGVAGFTTGVYVTLTVTSTLLRAPDIAMPCRRGTIDARLYSGLGYAMPKWLTDAVNYVLSFFTESRVDQVGSILKGPEAPLFHGDTSIPRDCASPSKGGA